MCLRRLLSSRSIFCCQITKPLTPGCDVKRGSRPWPAPPFVFAISLRDEIRVGGARTYRGQHRYGGDLGGTSGFPVKLGLHTIPTLDPLMNHIPSGR
jgi:hypothetical protein